MVAQRKLMASPVVPVVLCIVVLLVVWEGAILLFGIPPFVLPSLDGRRAMALSDFRGRKVILIEFASW